MSITPNFSGAGLEVICQKVAQKEQLRLKGKLKWTNKELVKQVHKVAKSLKLFFGDQTYPELAEDLLKNKLISLSFLNHVQNKTVFFISEGTRVSICYFFEQTQFIRGEIRRHFHFCKNDVPFDSRISTEGVATWLREGGDKFESLISSSSQDLATITRKFRNNPPPRATVIFHQFRN